MCLKLVVCPCKVRVSSVLLRNFGRPVHRIFMTEFATLVNGVTKLSTPKDGS